MLLDRSVQSYTYTCKFEYWYKWDQGYFYSEGVGPIPENTYHVAVGDRVMELVVLKQWLRGEPPALDEDEGIPGDPATMVTVPVLKWIDCVPPM